MTADRFKASRISLGDGRYQFSFKFENGARYVFECYSGEEFTQLNWRIGGNTGLAPKILRDRAEAAEKHEEELRRQALRERPYLDYDPEFHYSRISEYQSPGEEERLNKPSGLTIAERHRLDKLAARYPKP